MHASCYAIGLECGRKAIDPSVPDEHVVSCGTNHRYEVFSGPLCWLEDPDEAWNDYRKPVRAVSYRPMYAGPSERTTASFSFSQASNLLKMLLRRRRP